jgi:hypothetical protein
MDTDQTTTSSPEAAHDPHDLLAAIHEQGRQTLELVGTIVSLLMPKEGGRDGPTLEELLAKLLSQQQQIIMIGKATQADVDRLGKTLPDAVVEAFDGHRARLS